MFECRKYRIELWQCRSGSFHVLIQPIKYLGKDEFKRWIRLCKQNFMDLVSRRPWQFDCAYSTHAEALALARHMTSQLDEIAFFDRVKAQVQIVTPKETRIA